MSNTDRELLEWAAKAAGNSAQWDCDDRGMIILSDNGCDVDTWNPLADDGDALRLAVKLNICIHPDISEDDIDATSAHIFRHRACVEKHGNDPLSATRRAIVRAAAEIGKAMSHA